MDQQSASESTISKPILFSYFRSSASWRVRIVLNLKGIDYEYKAVNITAGAKQQFDEEYKKKNPMCVSIDQRFMMHNL